MHERPITIAIVALGGQGGGVLTGWLVELALANDWLVQSTYVAGVAQRTGATVYCVEMFPAATARKLNKDPVFALYPVPGDVDIVVASELAEAGRAVQKGFVTPNTTTLIASSHRVYSIDEKSALGDGRHEPDTMIDGVAQAAKKFVCFDMAEVADRCGCVVNSVMLGAIAGSGKLPFAREQFEAMITLGGRAVTANLAGFAEGFDRATSGASGLPTPVAIAAPQATGPNGRALADRIEQQLPQSAADVALHGALRALEYQDRRYAETYLDRLLQVYKLDGANGGNKRDFALTRVVAAQLALQMCYEDTIRVADLKTRPQRLAQIRRDLGAQDDQPAYVTEYFHPRFEEFCDTLPAWLGRKLQQSATTRRLTAPLFAKGRNLSTNKLTGYLMLRGLASLRRCRRMTLRFAVQQQRLNGWLTQLASAAPDYDYALNLARGIEIVRGYGDTYERGLHRYQAAVAAADSEPSERRAARLANLLEAAMADEEGLAFEQALKATQITAIANNA